VRIIFSSWVLYESLGWQFDYFLEVGGTDYTVTILPIAFQQFLFEYISEFLFLLRISATASIIGFFTPIFVKIMAASYFVVYAFHYSFFDAPVPWLYGWFPLIVLALSRCGDALSLDHVLRRFADKRGAIPEKLPTITSGWPLDMIRAWFIYIYFSAGLSKLLPLSGVINWIQNSPTQEILVYRYPHSFQYYLFGHPLFDYSSQADLISFGVFTVLVLELSTIMLLFTDRFDLQVVTLVTGMHLGLWLLGVPNFGLASLVLILTILIRKRATQKLNNRNAYLDGPSSSNVSAA
jgi:hypothetical protein